MRRSHGVLAALIPALFLTASGVAQMPPAQVVVAPLEKRIVERSQPLVATVEPVTRTTMAAEEAGLVAERSFDEGDHVKRGTVLARLNTDLLQAQLAAARATHESAAAMLERARADADHADSELKRIESIYRTLSTTEKEYRDALNTQRVARAMVAARAAEMAEKAAEVARLELLLSKAELRSPINGVVSRRHVEVGQWIRQGDPVADLVQLEELFVRINVPELLVPTLRVGDDVVVRIDALGGRSFIGKVEQILPEAEPASRTFPVRARLPNADLLVRPGFFARASLVSRTDAARFVVPTDALVIRSERMHVVAVRQGQAVIVPVVRSASEGARSVVEGELREDDVVVVRGNESLRPGEPLIVINPPGAPPAAAAASAATRPAAAQ